MENDEVNKIIAEFMGCEYSDWKLESGKILQYCDGPFEPIEHPLFTESLDILIPVWEKMGEKIEGFAVELNMNFKPGIFNEKKFNSSVMHTRISESRTDWEDHGSEDSFPVSAAHATALAIKELK